MSSLLKNLSILRKFLFINLIVFIIIGILTLVYLKFSIPNLIYKKTSTHIEVINNTTDHIKRLKIEFNEEDLRKFLFSTRFLFQSLDRVQFYDLSGNLIGDTNILDLDQSVFTGSDIIFEEALGSETIRPEIEERLEEEQKDEIKDIITNKYNCLLYTSDAADDW